MRRQVSARSASSSIVKTASRAILPLFACGSTSFVNVSTRTAGASRLSDAISGTSASSAAGSRCEWKIDPALWPTACTSTSPGCSVIHLPRARTKAYPPPPFTDAAAASTFMSFQIPPPPRSRAATSRNVSFASSTQPRRPPEAHRRSASQSAVPSPVSHTKWMG